MPARSAIRCATHACSDERGATILRRVDRWCATGWLQECFKANWADHKQLHKLVQAATENANCVEGYEPGASLYPPCRGMRVAVRPWWRAADMEPA